MLVGVFPDYLDGVLVRAYRAVSSQPVEFRLEHAFAAEGNFFFLGQRRECYIIDYAESEVVFGLGQCQILVYRDYLSGCRIVGAEAETSSYYFGGVFNTVEAFFHIQIQRLSVRSRFFGAVEDGNPFGSLGNGCKEVLRGERTVKVDSHHSHFLALCGKVVYGFAYGFGCRSHGDNYPVRVFRAVIVEQTVFAAGDFGNLVHVLLYYFRNGVIVGVAAFAVCEECVGIFGHAACHWMFRAECAVAEFGQCLLIHKRGEVLVVQTFYFLYFMRCAESVEEVEERHAGFDGCKVCHACQIHNFLYRAFA